MHGNAKNLKGMHFGNLLVLQRSDQKSDQGVMWECECLLCRCIVTYATKQLTSGLRTSCGNHPRGDLVAANAKLESFKVDGVNLAYYTSKPQKNTSTGVRGVFSYQLKTGATRYGAKLQVNGHQHRKRGFLTIESAYQYRLELEKLYLPENKNKPPSF